MLRENYGYEKRQTTALRYDLSNVVTHIKIIFIFAFSDVLESGIANTSNDKFNMPLSGY